MFTFTYHKLSLPVTTVNKNDYCKSGVSPGLVVMGGDSCFKGSEFESWHHILDGHDNFHIYLL